MRTDLLLEHASLHRLLILGYDPPPGYDGILQSPTPLGPNRIAAHEERFKVSEESSPYTYSYQLGTQLDNLNHIGVGPLFYGGHRGPEIAETFGTSRLGGENSGRITLEDLERCGVLGSRGSTAGTSSCFAPVEPARRARCSEVPDLGAGDLPPRGSLARVTSAGHRRYGHLGARGGG
jgi:hypothetical protein